MLLVRLRDDVDALALPMPFERRDELINEHPDTYFITDHYPRTNTSSPAWLASTRPRSVTYWESPTAS